MPSASDDPATTGAAVVVAVVEAVEPDVVLAAVAAVPEAVATPVSVFVPAEAEAVFDRDVAMSKEIDLRSWRSRPMAERLREWRARLWEFLL